MKIKVKIKENKAITLLTLTITIIIIIILSSIAIYSGKDVIQSSKFTAFSTEMKIMQTHVNNLYDQYINGNEETVNKILNMGESISGNTQAILSLDGADIPEEERDKYRLFTNEIITNELGIEGIKENEFLVNIKDRKIVSYKGFEYNNNIYYTLEQLTNGLYNVEYVKNSNIEFYIETSVNTQSSGTIYIKDIKNYIYINKWQVFYKLTTEEKWNTTETFTGNEYELNVNTLGEYEIKLGASGEMFSETKTVIFDTKPFLPEGAEIINNDLKTGLTIKDVNDNEWVWIVVPKSIYENEEYYKNGATKPANEEDYENIEKIMQNYAEDYRKSGYIDEWDSKEQHGFASKEEYDNWKNNMLKSVYANGGFYIGKYEVGIKEDRYRDYGSDSEGEHPIEETPVIQANKYVYNWVRCSQAQELSKKLAIGEKTSSLMFGIQWDMVCKYLEENATKLGATKEERQGKIKEDSSDWGNYSNIGFEITNINAKYSMNKGNTYIQVSGTYSKPKSGVLLTTGATERNSLLNIYDLAGNLDEWILEKSATNPCVDRGGFYYGAKYMVSNRYNTSIINSYSSVGFRPALY